MTDNHSFKIPEKGQLNWDEPLNKNFKKLDTVVPVVDEEPLKNDYVPKQGAMFVASDTGARFVGDGSQWNEIPAPEGSGSGIGDDSYTTGELDYPGVSGYPASFDSFNPEDVIRSELLIGETTSENISSVAEKINSFYE